MFFRIGPAKPINFHYKRNIFYKQAWLNNNALSHIFSGKVKHDNASNNDTWQYTTISMHGSHYCTCLGHLGQCDTNRNGPICVTPPK